MQKSGLVFPLFPNLTDPLTSSVYNEWNEFKILCGCEYSIPNTSYISFVSDIDHEHNEECELLNELRDQLATANYTINDLTEKVEDKDKLIEWYGRRNANQAEIISNLEKTIEQLTEKVKKTATSVYTQTNEKNLTSTHSQTDVVPLKSVQVEPSLALNRIIKPDATHIPRINRPRGNDRVEEQPLKLSSQQNTGETVNHRRNVLILSDSHGRHYSKLLANDLGADFETLGIVKPNATIDGIIADLEQKIKYFSKNDYLIVMAGANAINS